MTKRMITFAKAEATGNDFIIINSREIPREFLTTAQIKRLCRRRFGIGADGLIFLESNLQKQMRMHYFNADGSEGEMCGNGLRAAALYASVIGFCSKRREDVILAGDGEHRFFFNPDDTVSVEILIKEGKTAGTIDLSKVKIEAPFKPIGFLEVGVPHLVIEADEDIEKVPFLKTAKQLRNHPLFGSKGTNVNLIQKISDHAIRVRTYERGVEGETLSCGTGVTASALLFWEKYQKKNRHLQIDTKGGKLKVSEDKGRIVLTGPARIVFVGQITISN